VMNTSNSALSSKTKATVKAKADSAKVVGKFGPYCAQCVL
jgi:hypothetical protein